MKRDNNDTQTRSTYLYGERVLQGLILMTYKGRSRCNALSAKYEENKKNPFYDEDDGDKDDVDLWCAVCRILDINYVLKQTKLMHIIFYTRPALWRGGWSAKAT